MHPDATLAGLKERLSGLAREKAQLQLMMRVGPPLPTVLADRFGVQSQITMAIYPRAPEPYMSGLHQCSHPRMP